MKAAAYARVSTADQVDGFSLSAQLRAIRAHCASQGWTLAAEYTDEGVSASRESAALRPSFRQLMEDVDAGKVDVVIVHKLDRFSRNLTVTLQSLGRIDRAGRARGLRADHGGGNRGRAFAGGAAALGGRDGGLPAHSAVAGSAAAGPSLRAVWGVGEAGRGAAVHGRPPGAGVGRVYRHGTRIEGTDTDVATALLIGAAPLLLAACEAADLALADILMDSEELIESPTLVAALDALSVALDTSRVPTAKARARWGEFAAASGLST